MRARVRRARLRLTRSESLLLLLLSLLSCPSFATEVVWLAPPSIEDAARVAVLARATRGPMTPAEFRGRAVPSLADADVNIEAVLDALERVRVHETVLDGELLILDGLQEALEEVRFINGRQDRDTMIRALLYQGFAADRFWGDTLATDPAAAKWRVQVDGTWVERPWLDAFALAPLRVATDSDIAEAPQREAYLTLRRELAKATRATALAPNLPNNATLFVDGVAQERDETTVLELIPGRHWFHVEQDGVVLTSKAVRLDPAQRYEIELDVPENDWRALLLALRDGHGVVPSSIGPALEQSGGEIWFAEGQGAGVEIYTLDSSGVHHRPPPAVIASGSSQRPSASIAAWGGLAHVYSPDFRFQDPGNAPDEASISHAIAPVVGVELVWDRDWLRYGLGVDLTVPIGEYRSALSGTSRYRLRPYPHVIVGHPLVQGTFGWVAPYHLTGGVQGTVPIVDDLVELRLYSRAGGVMPQIRADGSEWRGKVWVQTGVSIGVRARPR
ncbi:MAG: hypothetical protein AB8H79_13990 [Myxococcota bacterium]